MNSNSEIGAAIIEAAAKGDLKKLKAIRKKVNDVWEFRKICDEYSDFSTGRTVLHLAAGIGHFEMCKFLINSVGVDIDAFTYKRHTPISEAVIGGHNKIVEFLIKQGADDGIPNTVGSTPLHYALLKDNSKLVELLVAEGALLDEDSLDGTPLQIAASRGNLKAVKSLLYWDADPNFYAAVDDGPLVCAVKSRSLESLAFLLAAKANPNMNDSGLSPLGFAAKEADTRFLKCLLRSKADPNFVQTDIYKPIEEAAMVHNRAAVEILFPVTARLPHYPNWTVDGIIEYTHSEEFKTMNEEKLTECLTELELAGMRDASHKDYYNAIIKYKRASVLDPSNPRWVSKRCLWSAHFGSGGYAMMDALRWIRLKPDLPVPHHGGENAVAANVIFKKFLMAGLAFLLDPSNEDKCSAFGFGLFNYFALLCEMSSPLEILEL
ncbi:E3 ubiquitin-protein ligase mib1-like [Salvia hispanica]|uniref:E3 ubiquitin-protein ligase mib1-like n=1 Tax=Salvia hispanica TaxID=49212 RepID=UPI0020093054|nr:E3 ubiquitin-protein ligase mib1-like [Salvia hispanica]